MPSDVFSFLWSVPEHGYKWIQAKVYVNDGEDSPRTTTHNSRLDDEPQWVLTAGLAIGQPYNLKQYRPLKNATGLFRTFAHLPLEDRDAVLEFANEYGHLGIPRMTDIEVQQEGQILFGVWGETWRDWMRHIDAMRRAVEIWDMVEARDLRGLSRYIQWIDEKWIYDSHPDLRHLNTREALTPPPLGRFSKLIEPALDLFKPGDVLMPASFLAQRWINEHLRGQVAPQVLYDLELGKRVLQIIPDTLLSAMWLQFAQAIDGNRKHRACRECGKWFEISTEGTGFRVNREFCSDPCKSKDYRSRKSEALRLKSEGKSVAIIAKALDTPADTIKKWTTKRKG
jgi:hypothetical protein